MSRSVPEWVGVSDDTRPPRRVLLRIFERYNGVCQCGCDIKIAGKPWEADHIKALINGGENRESNYQPLLVEHHKDKTAEDVAIKSKTYKVRLKDAGIKRRSGFRGWRKFNGDVVWK